MKRIFLILAAAMMSITVMAQVPQKFNYQALIRNADNEIVSNRVVNVSVSIVAENEQVVYSETHETATNSNGVLTIWIGGGKTTDDFSAIDWAKGNYFVKTETDLGGGVHAISGVSPLLSVPYALYAEKSGDSQATDLSGYALKTDLPDMENYATKESVPSVEGFATKIEVEETYAKKTDIKEVDLSGYALKTDLPDMEMYATKESVPSVEGFATKTEVEETYAKKTDIKEVDLSGYALKEELPYMEMYATKESIPSVEGFATKSDVEETYAKKTDLADTSLFARKTDIPSLEEYALKSELPSTEGWAVAADVEETYAKKTDIQIVDTTLYAYKNQIPSLEGYALKSELPSTDGLAVAADVEETYAKKTDIKEPDLTGYYSKVEVDSLLNALKTNLKRDEMFENGTILAGFSVSATEKVYFSQGNLQYQASTNTWRFAENQYDMIGEANKNISSTYSGWIDLFGWGTSGYNSKYPYMTSTDNNDYGVVGDSYADIAGTNYDWGVNNAISNGGNVAGQWRTLTYDEWNYVMFERSNASSLYGVACVNGVNGMVLLPDGWTQPDGLFFKSGVASNSGSEYYKTVNNYSMSEWSKMESAGAVFLPAAGGRNGTDVDYVGSRGHYWSSTANDYYNALYLFFSSDTAYMSNYSRYYGRSVRLVRSL
ncbi:MAG: hypothetical protein MJ198_06745 [Bacteroidales bacterium]|nr:hypothetical protein [Bacteroidales bacterium]